MKPKNPFQCDSSAGNFIKTILSHILLKQLSFPYFSIGPPSLTILYFVAIRPLSRVPPQVHSDTLHPQLHSHPAFRL